MLPLVVFDLDGTLVDSRRDLADSANELVEYYGGRQLGVDEVTRMVGGGARLLVQRALDWAGLDRDLSESVRLFLEIYDRKLLVHTRAYPGVPETLAALKGLARLAVLTNKPQPHTDKLLQGLHLRPAFDWVVGSEGAFARKPDPAGLRYLMRLAGTDPAETILVGDSVIDVDTARAASVRMCLVTYGFGPFPADGLGGPEGVVADPGDLPETLLRLVAIRA